MAHFPFRLEPIYQHRVWGGDRLQPNTPSTGEAWLVAPECVVRGKDMTLGDLAEEQGAKLMGSLCGGGETAVPLIVKLLDSHDWLSVQVHPTDAMARDVEGPGQFGKTETWHILNADDNAELIAGLEPAGDTDAFAAALRHGDPKPYLHHVPVQAGDTVHIPAGTVHALGPGLLAYEVQQASDLTYRGYDWDRHASHGRGLDLERFLEASAADSGASVFHLDGAPALTTVASPPPYRLRVATAVAELDPCGRSFHSVTAAGGEVRLQGFGWEELLEPLECLFIPADTGAYELHPSPGARVLIADLGV